MVNPIFTKSNNLLIFRHFGHKIKYMDKKKQQQIEKLLGVGIVSAERIGGFSAENYIVKTKDNRKFVAKFLRNNANTYVKQIEKVSHLFDNKSGKFFTKPIKEDVQHKIIISKFIKGDVLHGDDIKEYFYEPVAKVLKHYERIKPDNNLKTSFDLYFNIKSSQNKINDVKSKLKKTDSYYELVKSILELKTSILNKYKKDDVLVKWIKTSNSFVHGDFHNENILFSKSGVKAILDFELSHKGNSAEDMVNFVWFAFLNNDLSNTSLSKAHDFLKTCENVAKVSKTDLENAFKLTFLRFVQSSVLENSLIEYKEPFYEGLLKRDLKKFQEIDSNMSIILKKLLA